MDAQDLLTLAAVVVPTAAVAFTAWLNHNAHKGITNRIDGVDERSVQRDEAHRQTLESIARDVSFMAGRQTERDRQAVRDERARQHDVEVLAKALSKRGEDGD
jgi:hypothetical protein